MFSNRVKNIQGLKAFHGLLDPEHGPELVQNVVQNVVPEEESWVRKEATLPRVLPYPALYPAQYYPCSTTPLGYTLYTLLLPTSSMCSPRTAV